MNEGEEKRKEGLRAVEICNTRWQLRMVWKLYKDQQVRDAATAKAIKLPRDGSEPAHAIG